MAPPALDRLHPLALVALAIVGGLTFQLLLGTSYVAGSLDPAGESIGLPIGVVELDDGRHGARFTSALYAAPSGVVTWVPISSRDAAVQQMLAKELMGAIVIPRNFSVALESFASDAPRAAVVETLANPGASTSGSIVAERAIAAALDGLRTRIRDEAIASAALPTLGQGALTLEQARFIAQPVHAHATVVNPVPQGGANGLAPTYVAMAAWIGGYIGAVALDRFRDRTRMGPAKRAGIVAAGAALQGIAAAWMLGAIGLQVADPMRLALVIALGTWMAYAVVSLLLDLLGIVGTVPAFAILALGLPASGAMYPVEMLPPFFRALHPYDPFTWIVEGLRTAMYAPAAGDFAANATRLALLAVVASCVSIVVWLARLALDRSHEATKRAKSHEESGTSP